MKVENFETYRDGGTIEIETDIGVFCFDGRIGSTTKGRLYKGYPLRDCSNLIENSFDLEVELIESLKAYKHDFYQNLIDYLINTKTK